MAFSNGGIAARMAVPNDMKSIGHADVIEAGVAGQGAIDTAIKVERLTSQQEASWQSFAAAHTDATLYHGLAWRDVVRKTFGHETHYLMARAQDEVVGILPLVRLRHYLFGDFLVSVPFVNYGGVVANSSEASTALMHAASNLATETGSGHVEFRDLRTYANWPVRTDKVVMELALPASDGELWAVFSSKLRAQIRRAHKAGINTVFGGDELLREFYAVFARNMRDLGTPVYARSFFSSILATYPQSATLAVSRLGSQPVAAGLLLRHRDRLEIPWASSIRDYNQLGANMALYWSALQAAIEQNCRIFDFGRSTAGSGTYRFKQQWGAKPRQLYWHYWLRHGEGMPQLTPSNPKYRLAIALWKRLPLFAANLLGPSIVKNLP